MSRVGKQPVDLPAGVEVKLSGQAVEIKGPKGTLKRVFHDKVEISQEDGGIRVKLREESKEAMAIWGLSRSLLNNMVEGVSAGYTKVLEIVGVGYRAEVSGVTLKLSLGFSHPVEFQLPQGISATVDKNTILTLTGIDKELLGQTAANIRAFRPPEPYKGKGIRLRGEMIRRKVGKAGVK